MNRKKKKKNFISFKAQDDTSVWNRKAVQACRPDRGPYYHHDDRRNHTPHARSPETAPGWAGEEGVPSPSPDSRPGWDRGLLPACSRPRPRPSPCPTHGVWGLALARPAPPFRPYLGWLTSYVLGGFSALWAGRSVSTGSTSAPLSPQTLAQRAGTDKDGQLGT